MVRVMDCWWNNSTRFIPTENNLWQRSDWQSYCMLLYLCPKHAYWDNWLFNVFLVKCFFFSFFCHFLKKTPLHAPCCLIQDGMKNMLWNILNTNCQCSKQKGLCILKEYLAVWKPKSNVIIKSTLDSQNTLMVSVVLEWGSYHHCRAETLYVQNFQEMKKTQLVVLK